MRMTRIVTAGRRLGDEIILQGTIGQFNGLLQIAPDAITLVDTGNTLFDPTVITEYSEAMESQLVRIENVSLEI